VTIDTARDAAVASVRRWVDAANEKLVADSLSLQPT